MSRTPSLQVAQTSTPWSRIGIAAVLTLFLLAAPRSGHALGEVYVGGASCGGAMNFVDHIEVEVGADVTAEDICNFLSENGLNPSGTTGPTGPLPSQQEICHRMGGHWDAARNMCVLPESLICARSGGVWDPVHKVCRHPGPPPCGGCPTCGKYGPWDVLMASVPSHSGKAASDVIVVAKAGTAGKRKLFTLVAAKPRAITGSVKGTAQSR